MDLEPGDVIESDQWQENINKTSIRESEKLDVPSIVFFQILDGQHKIDVQVMPARSVWLGKQSHRAAGKEKINLNLDASSQCALEVGKLKATNKRNLNITVLFRPTVHGL